MIYDIVIVGAGPSGLALAQCLRNTYKKILIVEKENSIGGLHRVIRVPVNNEELFTEHSPRIYSNIYKNFIMLLEDFGANFEALFTPYNFTITEIGGKTAFSVLSFRELCIFGIHFLSLVINKNHGKDITVKSFAEHNNFNEKSIDMLDRICRLTDGAGIDRYTLYEFLQIFNQQSLYTIYQPRLPNDKGLFKLWGTFLVENGIEIMTNKTVEKIEKTYGLINTVVLNSGEKIRCNSVVLATPPQSFISILENSSLLDSFGSNLNIYSENTSYITYISSTLHWDKKLDLSKIYGFPRSEWGIAFIILSNYMTFEEKYSKTVISCSITYSDILSSRLGKTANQCNKDEILEETFQQLKEAYPYLETPTISLLSPEMYYANSEWKTSGKAFITSSMEGFLPMISHNTPNLYNVGTHNGKCKYAFTSMETAVTNAIKLAHILNPELRKQFKIKNITEISEVLRIILCIIMICILVLLLK